MPFMIIMIPTSWCNSQGLQSMECDGSASVTNGAGVNNSRNLSMPSPTQIKSIKFHCQSSSPYFQPTTARPSEKSQQRGGRSHQVVAKNY